VIVVDSREQLPYKFKDYEVVMEGLKTGDYSIKGYQHEFAIERKSLSDWAHSITQDRVRVEKEIIRAKKELKYFAFIIETDLRSIWRAKLFSKVSRNSLVNTALHWSIKYNIPFFFVSNRTQGKRAVIILSEAWIKYRTNPKFKEVYEMTYG